MKTEEHTSGVVTTPEDYVDIEEDKDTVVTTLDDDKEEENSSPTTRGSKKIICLAAIVLVVLVGVGAIIFVTTTTVATNRNHKNDDTSSASSPPPPRGPIRTAVLTNPHVEDRGDAVLYFYGESVAIHGDHAIVCAPNEPGGEAIKHNNNHHHSNRGWGSCSIYHRDDGSNWVFHQKIMGQQNWQLGSSVALGENGVALLGAPKAANHGAIVPLSFNNDVWEQQELVERGVVVHAQTTYPTSLFGTALSLTNGRAVVLAGDEETETGSRGVAHYYKVDSSGELEWTDSVPYGSRTSTSFTFSVDSILNTVVIGCDSFGSGLVYIHRSSDDGNTYSEIATLTAPLEEADRFQSDMTGLSFGKEVALIDEHTVVISDESWIPADKFQTLGAAYVFQEDEDGNWLMVQRITGDDGSSIRFGSAVAATNDIFVIGAQVPAASGTTAAGAAAVVYKKNAAGVWTRDSDLICHQDDVETEDDYYKPTTSVSISEQSVILGLTSGMNAGNGVACIFEL